jgi:RND family efflux transporter MFP subunit
MNTLSNPTELAPPVAAALSPRLGDTPVLAARAAVPRKARPAARWRRLGWKLLVGALVVGGTVWGGSRWVGKDPAQAREITGTVVRGMLPITVTERGELESSKSVDIRCEVQARQGAIKIVKIEPEGTPVKKGDAVVHLDTEELNRSYAEQEIKTKLAEGKARAAKEDLEMQRNKAESEIAKAQLTLTLAKLERDKYIEGEYKVELDKRRGEIALAKRELLEAEEKLEHYRKFVKKGFGTLEQLRYKEVDVLQKKFVLDSKEAELMVLEKFTKLSKTTELTAKAEDAERELARTKSSSAAGIAKAQSDWEASEVAGRLEKQALDHLKKQLDLCVIKAPQDGILVYSKERFWDPSSRIQPGAMVHFQQGLFTLPDLSSMQVKVKIHESMIKKIVKGQKAEIKVESYANQILHGTVEKMDTLADSRGYWDERGVKEYVTVVKIDDLPSGADLKPGMTAEVKILANELPNVLMVPVQAVAELEGEHFAYVVGAGVERRAVKVGQNNEKFVEVRDGLAEGEQVALDARARVATEAKAREGKPSEPKPGGPDAAKAVVASTPQP